MFTYFFTYWDYIPDGIGFQHFDHTHLTWLLAILFLLILSCVLFVRQSRTIQNRILKILAIILIGSEIYKYAVLIAIGSMQFQYLPFQLCGLAMFVELLYIFCPNPFAGELSCVVCLPGAAAALLFPDWTRYPVLNFMHIHGFVYHSLLVLIPLLLVVSDLYRPGIRRGYWIPLFFAVAAPIIYRINLAHHTNFMFLNWPSTGSPFAAIYQHHGYTGYLIAYGSVVCLVILIIYGIYGLLNACRKKSH